LPSTTLTATAAAPRDFTVYAFDDVAEQLAANEENTQQTSEEILLSIIDGLQDDKLTGFALRLALTAHSHSARKRNRLSNDSVALTLLVAVRPLRGFHQAAITKMSNSLFTKRTLSLTCGLHVRQCPRRIITQIQWLLMHSHYD
jgi:hypothetical protein